MGTVRYAMSISFGAHVASLCGFFMSVHSSFVDGTRQPDFALRAVADVALVSDVDFPQAAELRGCSFAYFGRFVHDLTKVCDACSALTSTS